MCFGARSEFGDNEAAVGLKDKCGSVGRGRRDTKK